MVPWGEYKKEVMEEQRKKNEYQKAKISCAYLETKLSCVVI